jgi:general secretion pathway protein L
MSIWLGIDIGRATVKAAVVRSAYRKTTLEALVVTPVALGDAGPDIVGAIRTASELALGPVGAPDAIAIGIDGVRATVRTVTLPAGATKQIADVLPFELEAQMPFEMSESVFDYRAMTDPPSPDGTEASTVSLMVGVARTAEVQSRIAAVREATGIEPERVGVGALPLANFLALLPADGDASRPVVLLDIGLRTTEVLVVVGQEAVFSRTLSQGKETLPGSAQELGREIRLSIGAFRAAGGAPPSRVYLAGGGAFAGDAASFLGAELDLPCSLLPPPVIDVGAAVTPASIASLPIFAKAIGLALGLGPRPLDLDLRKGPLAFERGFAWFREKIPVVAGLGAVVIVSFLFSAWAQLHSASVDQSRLEGALALVSKDVLGEETTSAARANELLGQETTMNDDDPLPHADAFDVMVKLSEDIPPTVVSDIEELDVQKGKVSVHGIVGSIPEAQSIAEALGKERCFAHVNIAQTHQVIKGDRQKYILELEEKCPEDTRGGKKKDPSASPSASASSSPGGK